MSEGNRAIEIIRLSLYADPMMEQVIVVKNILEKMKPELSLILLCLSFGIPKKYLKSYNGLIEIASKEFLIELEKIYGKFNRRT